MKLPLRIYHDALMQRGGAEKIALTWIEKFQVPLFVLAANPDLISEYKVHIRTLIPWIKSQKSLEFIYPFLPIILPFFKTTSEEIRLVSTTGIAHLLPGKWDKRILYIHSPARWIWDKESFDSGRNKIQISLANLLRPIFKKLDKMAIRNQDIILVNSEATKKKVFDCYLKDSEVLFPPVDQFTKKPVALPIPADFESFFLQVGRLRGYKGFSEALNFFQGSSIRIVVVGPGTERINSANVLGLGYVSDAELNWLYTKAIALLGLSKEDFGLTPIEAAYCGCPTIAWRHLGYLDSVKNGVSGILCEPYNYPELLKTMLNFQRDLFPSKEIRDFAKNFSSEIYFNRLSRIVYER